MPADTVRDPACNLNLKRRHIKGSRSLRLFDLAVVVLCLFALALLFPLRGFVSGVPLVAFSGAFVLLAAPGALLVRWFARELFPGLALIPAAVALGIGLYGLAGVPALLLHVSLNFYLVICGVILTLFLVAATLHATVATTRRPGLPRIADAPEVRFFGEVDAGFQWSSLWLWPPFALLGGALVFLAGVQMPVIDGDTWNYLAWVRDYLESDSLAASNPYFGTETGLSRILINGFFLEQAALARVSGIDPVTLALRYLSPTLTAVALLAFYALGRRLFGSGPALVAGCLYALFMLVNIEGVTPLFGREFLLRIIQDKGVARFVFMPVALCFAVGYLEKRKLRHLLFFGFLCWASIAVHPAGLAIIGISSAGYGLLHVVAGWKRWEAWKGATALALALLSILLVPAGYVLATGRALSSTLYSADIGDSDPVVLANQVFVREEWLNISVLDDGSYIMHPSLILSPAIVAAYVLGVPFLLWRMRYRGTAAQLLLGMLLVAAIVSYVPPVATFLGNEVVAPGQLHRLSWPIPLAGLLTLGWVLWSFVRWSVEKFRLSKKFVPPAVLALVCVLTTAVAPRGLSEISFVYGYGNGATGILGFQEARLDPVFRWMGRNITEPAVVLAPDNDNIAIPAYSADANVISFRGQPVMDNLEDLERVSGQEIEVPRGSLDMRAFYRTATPEGRVEILRRYEVDYVLIPAANPLVPELEATPGLTRLETPGELYALFAVDREPLGG